MDNTVFLPIMTFLSLFLFYQKANDNLMAKWYSCFVPLYIFFFVKFAYTLYSIMSNESNSHNVYNVIRKKIARFENISNLSRFILLLMYAGWISLFYYLGLFLDWKKDEHLFTAVYIAFGMLTIQLLYTFLRSLPQFSITKHAISYNSEEEGEDGEKKSSYVVILSAITGPVMTYFSNMMIVCSANTGMCTQFYFSTMSALFGAFGVSLSNFSQYLFPITVFLLFVSLFSLWIKKRDFTHGPFVMGCVATGMIIISHYIEMLWWLLYVGNVLMLGSAVWNIKKNRFRGLPKNKKFKYAIKTIKVIT